LCIEFFVRLCYHKNAEVFVMEKAEKSALVKIALLAFVWPLALNTFMTEMSVWAFWQ